MFLYLTYLVTFDLIFGEFVTLCENLMHLVTCGFNLTNLVIFKLVFDEFSNFYVIICQVSQIDDNTFEMFAPDQRAMDEAEEKINAWLTEERIPELEFGGIYKATVVEVRDIGVMVTLYDNMPPALLHNSQLDQRKVS